MNIAVVGAGWFGCHLASVLLQEGHNVTLFEKESDIFQAASTHNQCRLHWGFHYPRSAITRRQLRNAHSEFVATYSNCVHSVRHNLYAVSAGDSIMDFETYRAIMNSAGLEFKHEDPSEFGLTNIEGCISCDEKIIDNQHAKESFRTTLDSILRLGTPVVQMESFSAGALINGDVFHYGIDCTNSRLPVASSGVKRVYEVALLLVYESDRDRDFALTVMDGPFASLLPYYGDRTRNLFTLSSVRDTPIESFSSWSRAKQRLETVDDTFVQSLVPSFESAIQRFLPTFSDQYRYVSYIAGIKVKRQSSSAARDCIVESGGKVLRVLSNKCGNVTLAEAMVRQLLV